jgi:hypothetical protein
MILWNRSSYRRYDRARHGQPHSPSHSARQHSLVGESCASEPDEEARPLTVGLVQHLCTAMLLKEAAKWVAAETISRNFRSATMAGSNYRLKEESIKPSTDPN